MSAYLRFTIEYPDGATRELSVDSESVTVGSGAHCEIRLPGDDIPVEQLRVEARAGQVFAEARSMRPAALLNGLPFSEGRLAPNTTLQIAALRLRVECAEAGDRPIAMRGKKARTNPVVLALAAVGFPLGLYLVFTVQPEESRLGAAPQPPPLWAEAAGESCVHEDPAVAEAQAVAYLEQAEAHRERSPFSPQDGVASAELYGKAAACFARAEIPLEAEQARGEADHMKQATSRQFHVHQVRLERALATKDYDAAQAEARLLQAFVGTSGKEYGGWLSDLQRRIKLLLSEKKKAS